MFKLPDLKSLAKGDKMRRMIIVVGIIGIALIFISTLPFPKSESTSSDSVDEYRRYMQNSLCEMLSRIEGVGEVSVLLTIENSAEGVYLDNNSTKTKDIEPKIRGVVVACSGGDDPLTVADVTEAVTKALNISSARVCVAKMA